MSDQPWDQDHAAVRIVDGLPTVIINPAVGDGVVATDVLVHEIADAINGALDAADAYTGQE